MSQRRLAIILESHTERQPTPNAYDPAWYSMAQLLAHAGLSEADAHVDYLVPAKMDVSRMKWADVQLHVASLQERLAAYQPHFVLLLDRWGTLLRTFHGEKMSPDNWRGSVLLAKQILVGTKVMATYAPTRLRMDYGLTSVVRFDLKRAAEELRTDGLEVPVDTIHINCSHAELLDRLQEVYARDLPVAVDLEGYPDWITCIGFATSSNAAFVVPFIRQDGTSWWTEAEEQELWHWVKLVLEKPQVSKRMHNGSYEMFCLAWTYGIVIEGWQDDTMVMWFEYACEMEKSLGFITSILTRHPWYKHERKSTDDTVALLYNGKDCCRTYEICERMLGMLKPQQMEHYRFNMQLLAPLNYMQLRGIRYDHKEAKRRLAETQETIYELQDQINQEASKSESRRELREFYAALNLEQDETGATRKVAGHVSKNTSGLISLLTAAFCQARRLEKRTVTETSWQPMQVNSKGKWVKAGKRTASLDCFENLTNDPIWLGEEPPAKEDEPRQWLKPVHKQVTCNFPAVVETLEDVRRFAKDSCRANCDKAIQLAKSADAKTGLSAAHRGELATLLGIHIKIGSTGDGGDAPWYLYDHCRLAKQYQKEGNKLTDRLASDDEAIIKAYLKSGKDDASRDQRALTFLKMRKLVTQTKFLEAVPDADGRIRSGMNLVATPTCRMAMYGSPTGSSDLNLQTIGKGLRDLFVADEGCYIGQRDLSNSDAYTVAAFCAALGDNNMLDDLKAKIKPANVLARIYEAGPEVNQLSREQLREECKKVDSEGWLYFACKRVLHGSNYGMGKVTMANQILTDSFKLLGQPIWLEPAACERIQEKAFFVRYPGVRRWHDWMARELRDKGVLVASTGFQRRVFGRKDDHNTLKELLAHYPQYFTTTAIKSTLISPKGLPRQWDDPENRRQDGSLRVEPLLLVHDSNVSMWRIEDTDFAKVKMALWFDNSFSISNQNLTIPASGTYGLNWKDQPFSL